MPGTYTVAATQVTYGSAGYAPTLESQMISVSARDGPATAVVEYVLAIGSLTLTVGGLPAGTQAAVEVTGPAFRKVVTTSTTFTNLAPGSYTVSASSVTVGATLYNPLAVSQTVTVEAVIPPVAATVAYRASSTGTFNLWIDGMYVVQSTQTYLGAVPLVERRAGLLRVFVRANQVNAAQPSVRVRLYRNGVLLDTPVIAAPGFSVPTAVDEGDLTNSWNVVIPAEHMQPGLSVVADVDPGATVAEGNESDNIFPLSGTPVALTVRTAPTFRVRFVPIYQSANGKLGQVTLANRDQFLAATLKMHPVLDIAADVRSTAYTTSAPVLDPTDDDGWAQVLSEVSALRVTDPDVGGRYYYGVVKTEYVGGIAGLAYVSGRSALGWDHLPSGANVMAHELGHNWGRHHAPCGNVSRPDLSYPYSGGRIGVYGFDFSNGTVKSLSYTDLMGYCGAQWISDYTYTSVLSYREAEPAFAAAAPVVPSLLVWGRIVDGEPVLEPAFHLMARPSLPERPGPYAIEGQADDGSTIFSLAFAPQEVADAARGDQHFAFVVPLPAARAQQLGRLRLSGPRRSVTVAAPAPRRPSFRVGPAPGDATVRRGASGRVALRWNAAVHPVVLARDPVTGRVLSFARGGNVEIVADQEEIELVASDRVRSQSLRVRVPPR